MTEVSLYHRLFIWLRRVSQFWLWVLKSFWQDGCTSYASSLTYTSLLALVPLIIVIFSVLQFFPFFGDVSDQIQDFVFANFVPHTGTIVLQHVMQFEQQAKKLPLFGFIFLGVVALLMLLTLERTLNAIWGIRKGKRGFKRSLLMYIAFLIIGPILIGTSILITSYLVSQQWLSGGLAFVGMARLVGILPFVLTILGFTLIYAIVPNCTVRFWDAFRGALFAAILFEIAKRLFTFYVAHFPTYQLLYGALATIPLFLVWMYFSWLIFLLGAVVVNGLRLGQSC